MPAAALNEQVLAGITLSDYDFNSAGKNGVLGFTRTRRTETVPELSYTLLGNPIFKGPYSRLKYQFAWSLMLNLADAAILEAAIENQNISIQGRPTIPLTGLASIKFSDNRSTIVGGIGCTDMEVQLKLESMSLPFIYQPDNSWIITMEITGKQI